MKCAACGGENLLQGRGVYACRDCLACRHEDAQVQQLLDEAKRNPGMIHSLAFADVERLNDALAAEMEVKQALLDAIRKENEALEREVAGLECERKALTAQLARRAGQGAANRRARPGDGQDE